MRIVASIENYLYRGRLNFKKKKKNFIKNHGVNCIINIVFVSLNHEQFTFFYSVLPS